MDIAASQMEICRKYDADCVMPNRDSKVGISDNFFSGQLPLNGLRHPPEGDTCGWYLWAGETLSDASDFFKALHQLEHQIRIAPIVLLPPSGAAAYLGGVAEPDLAAQLFQQLFEPGRVTATLKANDYVTLLSQLGIAGAYLFPLMLQRCEDQRVDGSRFDCDNHALHSRHRSRKAWRDHCLVGISATEAAATSQVCHKRKAAGSSTCRKSLKTMVSRGGLEPPTR